MFRRLKLVHFALALLLLPLDFLHALPRLLIFRDLVFGGLHIVFRRRVRECFPGLFQCLADQVVRELVPRGEVFRQLFHPLDPLFGEGVLCAAVQKKFHRLFQLAQFRPRVLVPRFQRVRQIRQQLFVADPVVHPVPFAKVGQRAEGNEAQRHFPLLIPDGNALADIFLPGKFADLILIASGTAQADAACLRLPEERAVQHSACFQQDAVCERPVRQGEKARFLNGLEIRVCRDELEKTVSGDTLNGNVGAIGIAGCVVRRRVVADAVAVMPLIVGRDFPVQFDAHQRAEQGKDFFRVLPALNKNFQPSVLRKVLFRVNRGKRAVVENAGIDIADNVRIPEALFIVAIIPKPGKHGFPDILRKFHLLITSVRFFIASVRLFCYALSSAVRNAFFS